MGWGWVGAGLGLFWDWWGWFGTGLIWLGGDGRGEGGKGGDLLGSAKVGLGLLRFANA